MNLQVLTLLGLLMVPAFPLRTGQADMLPVGLLAAAPFLLAWIGLKLIPSGRSSPRLTGAVLITGGASLAVYLFVLALDDPFAGLLTVITFPLHAAAAIAALLAGTVARMRNTPPEGTPAS